MATEKSVPISDKTLKAAERGKFPKNATIYDDGRAEIRDAVSAGFGVRVGVRKVNDKRVISFFATSQFPNSQFQVRRVIGKYADETNADLREFTLAGARVEAERWRKQAKQGKDPRAELEKAKRQRLRSRANTFASVADDFIKTQVANTVRAKEVENGIRGELVSKLGSRPIAEIERADIVDIIKTIKDRGANYQAVHILAYAKQLFNWAIEIGAYGLETSPCDRLKPKTLGLFKTARDRILTDVELRAYWEAADSMGYPMGPLLQLLALTGQRKNVIAQASWSEIDLEKKLLVVPPERMKTGNAHIVPLSDKAVAILESLPRFKQGDFVFSTTFGAKPVNGFSKSKVALDKALAKALGVKVDKLEPYVLHDVRRTMRTHLSALPVEQHVRELVIGHTQQGLHKVYDQWAYVEEKRRALNLWTARLTEIASRPPSSGDKIVSIVSTVRKSAAAV